MQPFIVLIELKDTLLNKPQHKIFTWRKGFGEDSQAVTIIITQVKDYKKRGIMARLIPS